MVQLFTIGSLATLCMLTLLQAVQGFVIVVLVAVELVQSRDRRKLMAQREAELKA